MLPAEHARGEALLTLARDRFDPNLWPAEERVLRHSCAYEDPDEWDSTATLTQAEFSVAAGRDQITGRPLASWQGPELRPALLRWLLTDVVAVGLLEHRGLRVWNTRISSILDLRGCRIPVRIEFCYCLFTEQINLISAEMISLYFCESYLQKGIEGSRIHLKGPLFIEHVLAEGPLSFNSATIDGEVYLGHTELGDVGTALELTNATISDDIYLQPRLRSAGCLKMRGVRVGGSISLYGAELSTTDQALNIDHATVHDNISLTGNFRAAGEVSIIGAEIGGLLNCDGAELSSLWLDRLSIRSSIYLRNRFQCSGKIRMIGAEIGGQLDCSKATIKLLEAENVEIKEVFFWREIVDSHSSELNLNNATIKIMNDDSESWPEAGSLQVNGLTVQDLYPIRIHQLHKDGRIAWLNLQPKDDLAEPQPWLHLASHFEAKGHKRAAKRVIYELRKHQSRANWKNSRFRHLGYFWDTRFARLEQQPFYILVPILLLASLSGSIFNNYSAHFAPTGEGAYPKTATKSDSVLSIAYPKFQPYVYALENVLPVIKLGQDDKWAPDHNPGRKPGPTSPALYSTLVFLRWFLILAGWVMGGILAAAVSARFRS